MQMPNAIITTPVTATVYGRHERAPISPPPVAEKGAADTSSIDRTAGYGAERQHTSVRSI